MRILFVAADRMELTGIAARAGEVRPADLKVDFARRARLAGHEALLVANGAGAARAAAAVDAVAEFRPETIVSTGFCGALDERLAVADVVVATAVAAGPERYGCRPVGGAHEGVVVSIDHVAQTAEEKRNLRRSGACAVEMEAAGVASRALRLGVPFACVRVVTDLAHETMANDFNAALRADGHFATMFILRGALRRPTARLPELLRLRGRCVRSAQVLGDFIVGCRL